MNVGDVKTRVKRTFGDESGVQITDGDILRWINDGQREIVMRNSDLLEKIVTTDTVAGQQEYDFPTDYRKLRGIKYRRDTTISYGYLEGKSQLEFDVLIDGWEGPTYGQSDPFYYCVFSGKFKLFPIPDLSIDDGIKISYFRKPTDVVDDVDELDLPLDYHGAIIEYCLGQAYEMDEDWTSVGNKRNEFNAVVDGLKHDEKDQNAERYHTITVLPEDQDYAC